MCGKKGKKYIKSWYQRIAIHFDMCFYANLNCANLCMKSFAIFFYYLHTTNQYCFLECTGVMDPKNVDNKKQTQGIRRPFGVGGVCIVYVYGIYV